MLQNLGEASESAPVVSPCGDQALLPGEASEAVKVPSTPPRELSLIYFIGRYVWTYGPCHTFASFYMLVYSTPVYLVYVTHSEARSTINKVFRLGDVSAGIITPQCKRQRVARLGRREATRARRAQRRGVGRKLPHVRVMRPRRVRGLLITITFVPS